MIDRVLNLRAVADEVPNENGCRMRYRIYLGQDVIHQEYNNDLDTDVVALESWAAMELARLFTLAGM